jgi:hypothetical protein
MRDKEKEQTTGINDLITENQRLTEALRKANDQAEYFERQGYLLGDALERLRDWADAYPLDVFPEPDFEKAQELLQFGGITLDAISASIIRHVVEAVRKQVDEILLCKTNITSKKQKNI